MTEKEIHHRLNEIEARLKHIEEIVLVTDKKQWAKSDYEGLSGGLRLLVHNGFFEKLREVSEVNDELKREGYHCPLPSISKMLSVNFTNKQKILTRTKEGTVWKYMIRK